MSRGRWNMLAALIALGLVLPACRHKPPVLKPRRVDEPKPPPAAARDETGPPAAAAEDKRPEPEAVSSAPATAAETACAELEKIARVQSFVATYELWRVGMEGRIPFELAYAKPDKCRLVVDHPRISMRYYASGGKVYVFAPDGSIAERVTLPLAFAVTDIGTDYVLGVTRDDQGVERVELHDLRAAIMDWHNCDEASYPRGHTDAHSVRSSTMPTAGQYSSAVAQAENR